MPRPDQRLACVYGALLHEPNLPEVWLIWKHRATGELLGPAVVGGVDAEVVQGRLTQEGWEEIGPPKAAPIV